jgi:hypothetical protein
LAVDENRMLMDLLEEVVHDLLKKYKVKMKKS